MRSLRGVIEDHDVADGGGRARALGGPIYYTELDGSRGGGRARDSI